MKPILLSILFAAGVLAAADDTAPFSGKWQVHTVVASNESDSDCTFTQTGSELSGSCVTSRGTVQITGKADGKTAAWSFKSEHDGTPLVVAYKGTLGEDGKMKGAVSVEAFGVDGEFTAARPK